MSTGIDVGKTRLDDLDRMVLRESLAEPFAKQIVCNFGCGESALSVALGALGHRVYNYDNRDLSLFYMLEQERGRRQHFTQVDLDTIKKHLLPKQIDCAVFSRVLHYLPYVQARRLLQMTSDRLVVGGCMYLNVSGVESNLARGYTALDTPVETRMAVLGEQEQEEFNIHGPVCLYTESELRGLVESVESLEIVELWTSQFGNIKAVVKKVVE